MEKITWKNIGGRKTQQDISLIGSVPMKWIEWIAFFLHLIALFFAVLSLSGLIFVHNEIFNRTLEIVTLCLIIAIVVNHTWMRFYSKHVIRKIINDNWLTETIDVDFDVHCDLELGEIMFSPGLIPGVKLTNDSYWLTKNKILDLKNLVIFSSIQLNEDIKIDFHVCPELLVKNMKSKTLEFSGKMHFEDESITTDIDLTYKLFYNEKKLVLMSSTPGKEFNIQHSS